MKRIIITIVAALAAVLAMGVGTPASAQSGHFIERTVRCTDMGTWLRCTAKVAGLGGTTFQVLLEAEGTATVQCTNPGGNIAPGQRTTVQPAGDTDEMDTPRNGQSTVTVSTDPVTAPDPAEVCPNGNWTAAITDVTFTSATLKLLEDGEVTDTFRVF